MMPSSGVSHLYACSKFSRLTKFEIVALVLVPLFFVVLVLAINFPDEFNLLQRRATSTLMVGNGTTAVPSSKSCNTAAKATNLPASSPPPPPPEFRVLIGVLTMADKYEVRQRHRLVNSFQPKTTVQIDVKFVFCNLTRGEQRALVSLEALRYDDIMILNCKENMNDGKTFLFFSTVAKIFNSSSSAASGGWKKPYYDYVMKADDDTHIRFPALAASLKPLPRIDLYYGFYVDPGWFREGDPAFMAGMAYLLSWDLVDWIASSDVPRNRMVGYEDRVVGMWLRDGGKGKNIYDTKPSAAQWEEFRNKTGRIVDKKWFMYDLPKPPARYLPNTVCIHRIKTNKDWENVIEHFHLTDGLKPSRFHSLGHR